MRDTPCVGLAAGTPLQVQNFPQSAGFFLNLVLEEQDRLKQLLRTERASWDILNARHGYIILDRNHR